MRTPPAPRRATNADILHKLEAMAKDIASLKATVGQENDRGDGGTGLAGKTARVSREVAGLTAIKLQAQGAIAAVTLLSVVIILGLKQWVQTVVYGGSPHG